MGALEGGIQLVGDRLFLREFVSDDCSAVQSYAGDAGTTTDHYPRPKLRRGVFQPVGDLLG